MINTNRNILCRYLNDNPYKNHVYNLHQLDKYTHELDCSLMIQFYYENYVSTLSHIYFIKRL